MKIELYCADAALDGNHGCGATLTADDDGRRKKRTFASWIGKIDSTVAQLQAVRIGLSSLTSKKHEIIAHVSDGRTAEALHKTRDGYLTEPVENVELVTEVRKLASSFMSFCCFVDASGDKFMMEAESAARSVLGTKGRYDSETQDL